MRGLVEEQIAEHGSLQRTAEAADEGRTTFGPSDQKPMNGMLGGPLARIDEDMTTQVSFSSVAGATRQIAAR